MSHIDRLLGLSCWISRMAWAPLEPQFCHKYQFIYHSIQEHLHFSLSNSNPLCNTHHTKILPRSTDLLPCSHSPPSVPWLWLSFHSHTSSHLLRKCILLRGLLQMPCILLGDFLNRLMKINLLVQI